MVASGVLGSALGTVCFTEALTLLNASLANLLLNVQPVISVLVSWFWLRERPLPRFYPWAAVALAVRATMAWSPDAVQAPHRLALGLAVHRSDRRVLGRLDDVRPGGDARDRLQDRHWRCAISSAPSPRSCSPRCNGNVAERLRWSDARDVVDTERHGRALDRRGHHPDLPLLRGPREDARVGRNVRRDGADVCVADHHLGRDGRAPSARSRSRRAPFCSLAVFFINRSVEAQPTPLGDPPVLPVHKGSWLSPRHVPRTAHTARSPLQARPSRARRSGRTVGSSRRRSPSSGCAATTRRCGHRGR